jgi:hypothetical protein
MKGKGENMSELIQISALAAALNVGTRPLAEKLADHIVRNAGGLDCVPAELSLQLINERDKKLAERERQAQAGAAGRTQCQESGTSPWRKTSYFG